MSAPTSDISSAGRYRRRLNASIAANERWSREDGVAGTAKARRTFLESFEKQVDPHGVLTPKERARRAESARRAHFLRLAKKSAEARRARRAGSDAA